LLYAGGIMNELLRGLSILFIVIIMVAIIGGHAQAQDGSQSKAVLNTDVQAAPSTSDQKIFSGAAGFRQSSNMINRGKAGHQAQSDLDLSLSARINEIAKISISQGISKSYQEEEELDLTNTKIGIKHNRLELHRDAGMVDGMFVKLPTNRRTREKDKLTAAMGVENLIDIRPGIGPIVLNNRLIISKNFHEYTVNAYGSPTIEWSLNEGLTTTAELGKVVSVSLDISYLTSRTYHGTTKSRMDFTEEIALQVSNAVQIALGYTNGSDLVASTQKSSNIEAFNDESATIYGALNVTF
jgi:hypothetical protein